jgi:hypothetical protein
MNQQPKPEIFVSTDVETNGPIPGEYSMLSFGSAAFTEDGVLLSTFTANIETLVGSIEHPRTMEFWNQNPKIFKQCTKCPEKPILAMKRYHSWLSKLPGKPVFVGYPASWDFMFIYWYLVKFVGYSIFSWSAFDMKTAAMILLKRQFRKSTKKYMKKRWPAVTPHTHIALDDAIEQGEIFCGMLKEIRGK